jgi:hypothetical protein
MMLWKIRAGTKIKATKNPGKITGVNITPIIKS